MENKQPTLVQKNNQPKTQKSLFDYFISCWTENYANFKGRASRKEFWSFMLPELLLVGILNFFDLTPDFSNPAEITKSQLMIYFALSLVFFIPGTAVYVRRLHDIDKSGWWLLLSYIPLINLFALCPLLKAMFKDGDVGTNQYGKNPKSL